MNIQAYIQSGIIETYVLGLATTEEVVELQGLCVLHPEIKAAVIHFENELENEALITASKPAETVKTKLFEELKNEFVNDVKKDVDGNSTIINSSKVIKTNWLKYVAAASVILLAGSAALNFYFYNKYDKANTGYLALLQEKNLLANKVDGYEVKFNELNKSLDIVSHSNMKQITLSGLKGFEKNLATVYWDMNTKDVYLLANKLDKTPTKKQYQLWAIVEGKPFDVGMIDDCTGLCKLKTVPENASMFAITLEDDGGSTSPKGNMYVAGAVTK